MMPDAVQEKTLLNAALELVDHGFSVIPVARETKKSLISWGDFQNRIPTEDEVESWFSAWPDANIAIVTGVVSGLVVVDQDAPEGGEWIAKNLPYTPIKCTTKKGKHHYYRHPGTGFVVQNQVGVVSGVDIRGDGGYVVADGSVHESGFIYRWDIDEGFDLDMDHCPIYTLKSRQKPGVTHSGNLAHLNFLDCKPEPVVRDVPEGARNHELARLLGKWIGEGHSEETVRLLARGWNSELTRPLPWDEVAHTIGSLWATHLRNHPDDQRLSDTTCAVMSDEDVQASRATLDIPPHIQRPGGLLSTGMDMMSGPGLADIPQYALPVILTTIAHAIAGKMTFQGTWPNLYNIKVGPTSTGKTTVDKAIKAALRRAGVGNFYGITNFASGPALMRSLVEMPRAMVPIDEATALFRRYTKTDAITEGKRDALLEIYSASGDSIKIAYADAKNVICVNNPCLSLTGNVTPAAFDALKIEDFETGLIQRFDFWCYDGEIPQRGCDMACTQAGDAFAIGIIEILNAKQPGDGNLQDTLAPPHEMAVTADAGELLGQYSVAIIDACNATESNGERGIISRKYDLAKKYAMIHAAGTRAAGDIYDPLTICDIRYGVAVADMLAQWKLGTLMEKVVTGDFHKDCEVFKSAILAAMRTGQRPTFKLMANRRRELKNWKKRDSEEIISVLVKRGEVIVDESKRPTAYFLAKEIQR